MFQCDKDIVAQLHQDDLSTKIIYRKNNDCRIMLTFLEVGDVIFISNFQDVLECVAVESFGNYFAEHSIVNAVNIYSNRKLN